ncbi:DUF2975 domain-containing protein [Sutcliffiella rhizosphaerae]|uniref:DUF2975 domain-containing protein n=1 Tax=Sutcliffiella rhizosphaerae TaxID=2880967 RepID=A0ABN8ADG2_9BACI|nr:DUF2975 domain-containing protein [Sutcliffiella rhizosphaerae]CAG9621762.1 hypothetical protein BACCIP111883_02535 [Sutcliffiella rhizosphaerae]
MFPEYAFLQYPGLLGLYVTTIPFFIALYQASTLLNFIENHNAFSESAVIPLNNIKKCAILISNMYVIGCIFLLLQNALHPGIGIIALIIIFSCSLLAVFTAVLKKLLTNAIVLKAENESTV